MAHCTHPRAELFANTSLAEDEKTYRIVFEDNVFPLESSALLIHWYSVCVNLRNISSFRHWELTQSEYRMQANTERCTTFWDRVMVLYLLKHSADGRKA